MLPSSCVTQIDVEEADLHTLPDVLEAAAGKLLQYQYQGFCACNVRCHDRQSFQSGVLLTAGVPWRLRRRC